MQLFGAKLFFLLVVLDNSQSRLKFGSYNVCSVMETFTERSYVVTKVPKIVTTKNKCWNIFKLFSCERTEVINEHRTEPRIVTKSKRVPRCCRGYREENWECVPICTYGCINGVCREPEVCLCNAGYYGPRCERECPEGRWGYFCTNKCNCHENARCDRVSGCVCQPGWKGKVCESPCEDGFYGHLCQEKCNCNDQSCNHKTGECKTTTETQTTTIGPTFTTSTVEVISTQLFTTTELFTTVERNENTDKTRTSETSAEDSREGVSVEMHLNIEKSTTTSRPENFEISHSTTDSLITTDVRTIEEETVTKLIRSDEKEDATATSTTKVSIELPGNFTPRINFENGSDEPIFDKTKLKVNLVENEVISDVDLSVTTENPDQVQSKAINNISGSEMFGDVKINTNKSWINLIAAVQADKNETESLIFERNGSASQETVLKWVHFLPTLSVLPAVSFLIILIAAMWVLMKHRRKSKMVVVVSEKNRVFQFEERVKFQADDGFWVNNCTLNPVYLSDVDLNNTPPALETFKPLNNDKRFCSTTDKNKLN